MNDDRQRFEALCFLYACNKTDQAQGAWLEDMLARHPQWRPLLEAEQALVRTARAGLAEQHAKQPELLSAADIMALAARVAAERAPGGAPADPVSTDWRARLLAWWRRPLQRGYAYGALALLAVSVSVQTWRLEQQPDAPRYRSVPAPAGSAAGVYMRVVFHDDVSLGRLRTALATLGLSIVQGPDQHGAYVLAAGVTTAATAAQQLQASGLALDVQLLPRYHDHPQERQQ